jgi:hypothetical protein
VHCSGLVPLHFITQCINSPDNIPTSFVIDLLALVENHGCIYLCAALLRLTAHLAHREVPPCPDLIHAVNGALHRFSSYQSLRDFIPIIYSRLQALSVSG